MNIPELVVSKPYRPEASLLLHDAFEAFWKKDFLKAWKLSILASASPLTIELRPGGCAPEVFAALNYEFRWAVNEMNRATGSAFTLLMDPIVPADIEVSVDPLDNVVFGPARNEYGRSLSTLDSSDSGLSIHGRIAISRHFLARSWPEPGELRRICLQQLAEVLGLNRTEVATGWCSHRSCLQPRQLQALCALADVREFFERQPAIQEFRRLPLWPRQSLFPSHAVCEVRSAFTPPSAT